MKRNINVRVEEEIFNEIQSIAWLMGVSRSNMVRQMIEYFREKALIRCDGREFTYEELLGGALEKLAAEGMEPEDLFQRKSETEDEAPIFSQFSNELEELAKIHVESVKKAWLGKE